MALSSHGPSLPCQGNPSAFVVATLVDGDDPMKQDTACFCQQGCVRRSNCQFNVATTAFVWSQSFVAFQDRSCYYVCCVVTVFLARTTHRLRQPSRRPQIRSRLVPPLFPPGSSHLHLKIQVSVQGCHHLVVLSCFAVLVFLARATQRLPQHRGMQIRRESLSSMTLSRLASQASLQNEPERCCTICLHRCCPVAFRRMTKYAK